MCRTRLLDLYTNPLPSNFVAEEGTSEMQPRLVKFPPFHEEALHPLGPPVESHSIEITSTREMTRRPGNRSAYAAIKEPTNARHPSIPHPLPSRPPPEK